MCSALCIAMTAVVSMQAPSPRDCPNGTAVLTDGCRGFFTRRPKAPGLVPTAGGKRCANKCLLHVTSEPANQLTRELLVDPLTGVETRVGTCSSQPGHRLTSQPAKQVACSQVNQVTVRQVRQLTSRQVNQTTSQPVRLLTSPQVNQTTGQPANQLTS